MPTADGCYPWQPDCEWTIRFLWRWMSPFGRLDVIVLALMLVYLFVVVIHVYCRYYVARRTQGIDSARTRTLAAVLNIQVGGLKSIAVTAPYLGLVGTCEGILSALGGWIGSRDALRIWLATKLALALVPIAAAIPVAALATSSYNYLRARVDLLEGEVLEPQRERYFRGARRFTLMKRFSELPAFVLLAAPSLAMAIAGFMIFPSLHLPMGLYVELASARCEYDVVDRLIVLHITDTGKVFLNQEQEDWSSLGDRLSAIYSMREHRTIYLLADSDVPFQTVAQAIATVENASATVGAPAAGMKKEKLGIKVRLVTPKAFNAACHKPGHLVLR